MNKRQYIGKLGEDKSVEYLIDNKYQIIERNFHCKFGEIDIIALDKQNDEIVFVEVKTRTNLFYGMPADAINHAKIEHIKKTINYYIIKNKIKTINIRVDVIEVFVMEKKCIIHHIKQAI